MRKKCPTCGSSDDVREYLYGMPSEEPDPAKYVVGGCLVWEDMPDYKCISCSTDFYKNSEKFQNRFISDGAGITFLCKSCNQWIPSSEDWNSHECSNFK